MFMTIDKVKSICEQIFRKDITTAHESISDLSSLIRDMNQQISELRTTVDELNHLRDRKDSNEPWFEFVGGDVNPEHGLELRLDWNDAFIKQLGLQGYLGTSDDELIAQYIANVQKMVDGKQ